MPANLDSYSSDVWEMYESLYEEIQNYYKEGQEYYEEIALQRAG